MFSRGAVEQGICLQRHFSTAALGSSPFHLESFLHFSTAKTRNLKILKSVWTIPRDMKYMGVQKVFPCSPKHSIMTAMGDRYIWLNGYLLSIATTILAVIGYKNNFENVCFARKRGKQIQMSPSYPALSLSYSFFAFGT